MCVWGGGGCISSFLTAFATVTGDSSVCETDVFFLGTFEFY